MRTSYRITFALALACGLAASARADTIREVWDRPNLFGSMGQVREGLDSAGIGFEMSEISDLLGVASGGMRQGVAFSGVLEVGLRLDADKAFGWPGGRLYVSALQLHGSQPSLSLVGSLQTVSSIEGDRATRMYDTWVEQCLLIACLRVGQLRADDEFLTSQYVPSSLSGDLAAAFASGSNLFVNGTFGFPGLPASHLPAGGPSYPLPTPGARLRVQATDRLGLFFAVFNGDPDGPGAGDPQKRNASGASWHLCCGVLAFAEAQYAVNLGPDDIGPVGTYRFGAYYHSGDFADLRSDTLGVSLASPASNGVPLKHSGGYSVYAQADQMLWQSNSEVKSQGIGVFARVMGAPPDTSLVDFYADAGVTWKGPFPGRDDDSFGVGVSYAHISKRARQLDTETAYYTGTVYPVRDYEAVLEATYQAQLAGWWLVQPDVQWVLHPGGGVSNPYVPTRRVPDAVVVGLRSLITF